MKILKELQNKYYTSDTSAKEILDQVFKIYLPDESVMKSFDLEINYHDYGIYQLRQKGEFLYEGKETDCLEEAYKIVTKYLK
jgi:hypothetical protein